MMFSQKFFNFKTLVLISAFVSFSSEANEKLKSLVSSSVKFLPITETKNSELGLYWATCTDINGKGPYHHRMIVGKHKSLASGEVPFGYLPTFHLATELASKRPADVFEDLYRDGIYNHYTNKGELIHETYTGPNLELLEINVSGETMSTAYSSVIGNSTVLSLGEENTQRFFVLDRVVNKTITGTCRTDYLVRQFYKGTTQEKAMLSELEIKALYNIDSPIYSLFGGLDSSGLNPQGIGVLFSSNEGEHWQTCSWTEEGTKDFCSNVTPSWTILIAPGTGVKLTSFKSGFALDNNGTLRYSVDSFKTRIYKDKSNPIFYDLMPISTLKNYKILDYAPYHKERLCLLTDDREVLCTNGLIHLLSNNKYAFKDNPAIISLGKFPKATQIEYQWTSGTGTASAEEYLFLKDTNNNIIKQFDFTADIRRLLPHGG